MDDDDDDEEAKSKWKNCSFAHHTFINDSTSSGIFGIHVLHDESNVEPFFLAKETVVDNNNPDTNTQ